MTDELPDNDRRRLSWRGILWVAGISAAIAGIAVALAWRGGGRIL